MYVRTYVLTHACSLTHPLIETASLPHSIPLVLIHKQAKQDAQAKLRQAQADLSNAQDALEEEQEMKAMLQKQLMAAKNEAGTWKNKFENEATPRIEELEDAK